MEVWPSPRALSWVDRVAELQAWACSMEQFAGLWASIPSFSNPAMEEGSQIITKDLGQGKAQRRPHLNVPA
ncbi:hypothetical protein CGLO_15890 [Colletotrichum gloeosporioides Cg-14]|uniref:Uncharacterized protein n=1 Tax=Colletotrichum gloeosporioides (strain Cg-14) TaxID=1237896 RepID=T0L132_COLGC|nr:hypothetical protein CGLO_15890 [Colletotrichum gloeosporioides Cg-14]